MFDTYRTYLGGRGMSRQQRIAEQARADLMAHAQDNPDYHGDTMRNGVVQPFILTRSGEKFCYNVICMPGDELFGGDIIDAFGEKWIVTEARADATTHKTGIMHQCNQLFRFQNFTSEIIERWAWIDQSGYSSAVTGTSQMQKAEEQFAIYLPYDKETAKIYVDKRLASHVAFDQFGEQILSTFKVTSAAPNTFSYNKGDRLLGLKAVRDVYSPTADNLAERICDYISPDGSTPAKPTGLRCEIKGAGTVLLGRSRTYQAVFYDAKGKDVSAEVTATWSLPEVNGVTYKADGNKVKVSVVALDALIGTELTLGVSADGYDGATMMVEVGNIA